MKNKLTKLSELQASLIIAGSISAVIILLCLIGVFNHQPGWIIGAGLGALVEVLYILLVEVGTTIALKESKSGLFLLTYFLRVISFVGIFALLVIMQYMLHVEVFYYSCWGMLLAFSPATIVTIAVQLMHKAKQNG